MSKDDSDDFGSSELTPLDGDLLEPMGPAELPGEPGAAEPPVGLSPGLAAAEPAEEKIEEKIEEKVGEEVEEEETRPRKFSDLLAKLAESNPYTVMLVVSLVALLIGICCLLLEWGSYGFQTKPKEAEQSASAATTLHLPPDAISTTDLGIG